MTLLLEADRRQNMTDAWIYRIIAEADHSLRSCYCKLVQKNVVAPALVSQVAKRIK
jgi:hypothetical protein